MKSIIPLLLASIFPVLSAFGAPANLPDGVPVTNGLIVFLDGEDLDLDGDKVIAMHDRSGSGNHALQRVGLPYLVEGVTPSGQDAIRFDGVMGYAEVPSNPEDFDGLARTTLAVFRANVLQGGTTAGRITNTAFASLDSYEPLENQPNGRTRTNAFWAETGGRLAAQNRNFDGDSITARSPEGSLQTGKFYVGGNLWRDGFTTAILIDENNQRIESGAIGAFAEPEGHAHTRIGAGSGFGNDNPDHFFDGEIAALLVYNRELSPPELAQVEGFLYDAYLGAGPGVGGLDLPPVTDGLILHVNAANTVQADGSITQLTDVSGRNNHAAAFVHESGVVPPNPIRVEGGTPTGRNVVRFDGVNQYLEIPSNPADFDGRARTTLVVFRPDDLAERRVINNAFTTLNPEDPNLETIYRVHNMFPNANGSLRVQNRNSTNGAATIGTPNGTVTIGTFHLGISEWKESGDTAIAVRNASNQRFGNSGSGADAVPQGHIFTRIGADSEFRDPEPIDFFAGDVAAVVIFNRELSETELQQMEEYLFARYMEFGYQKWIAGFDLPEHLRGPLVSVLGDGVTNLEKYAFGMEPTSTDPNKLPTMDVITFDVEGGVLLAWDVAGTGTVREVDSTTNVPGIEPSTVTMGPGILEQSLVNGFSARGWGEIGSDFEEALADGHWFEFSIEAEGGYSFDLDSLQVKLRTVNRGPETAQWGYSLDGTTFLPIDAPFPLDRGTGGDGHFYDPVDLSGISALQNAKSVTFRLVGWGASGAIDQGRTLAIGRLGGDNLIVSGSVRSDTPERFLSLAIHKDPGAVGITTWIEGSYDMVNWSAEPPEVAIVEESVSFVRVRLEQSMEDEERGFLRVRVTLEE